MRNDPRGVDDLAALTLFSTCTKRELNQIRSITAEVHIRPGEVLAREGTPGREAYVIVDGTARVTLRGRTLATLVPGDFFGEMSLLENAPRSATVTAETPMRVLVLGPAEFDTLISVAPSVSRTMLRGIAERLRAVEKAGPLPARASAS
jgi:CRP-like cAMP-binding protein